MTKTGFRKWQLALACALTTCLPLTSMAEPYFANKEGNLIWDKATGLVWMRCSLGQTWKGTSCSGKPAGFSIASGLKAAKNLNDQGGYASAKDWGLPSIRQLASIRSCSKGFVTDKIDLKDGGPALPFYCEEGSATPTIHPHAFPASSVISYWSSTPFVGGDPKMYWSVDFRGGTSSTMGAESDSAMSFDGRRALPIGLRLVRARKLSASEAAPDFAKEMPPAKATGAKH